MGAQSLTPSPKCSPALAYNEHVDKTFLTSNSFKTHLGGCPWFCSIAAGSSMSSIGSVMKLWNTRFAYIPVGQTLIIICTCIQIGQSQLTIFTWGFENWGGKITIIDLYTYPWENTWSLLSFYHCHNKTKYTWTYMYKLCICYLPL